MISLPFDQQTATEEQLEAYAEDLEQRSEAAYIDACDKCAKIGYLLHLEEMPCS